DDQVGLLPAVLVQHMIATVDYLDVEVVALQVAGDQLGQGAVVFDQENIRHRSLEYRLCWTSLASSLVNQLTHPHHIICNRCSTCGSGFTREEASTGIRRI